MNWYEVRFWIANDKKRKEIDLTKWEDIFIEAGEQFNTACKTARNPKKILKTEIEPSFIKVLLSSQTPLSTPTLALRTYSQFLVDTEFGRQAAVDNALFRGSWEAVESEKEDITGPEMIKILAELLMAARKSDAELIENIKQQLMEWRDRNVSL